MTVAAVAVRQEPALPVNQTVNAEARRHVVETAIASACNRIAPLWPLKHFVAVNPFLGFSDHTFASTCATMRRVARVDMLMPRGFYRQALADGLIEDRDIEAALADSPVSLAFLGSVEAVRRAAACDPKAAESPGAAVATVAEVLDRLAAGDRHVSRTAFMIDEISRWCAAYFDQGQSVWRLPARSQGLYAAWRTSMRHNRNPEVMGIKGFRAAVAAMPSDPVEAICSVVEALGIPTPAIADYLYRALFDINGWAGYARYLVWNNALYGRPDDTLVQLLAVRVAWGYALYLQRLDEPFATAWRQAMTEAAAVPGDAPLGQDHDLCIDLVLQEAYEKAYQRRLISRLRRPRLQRGASADRPAVQAAFCIDVRSEIYRRALETVSGDVETIGFAGFFGFPIEYVPIGKLRGGAQCPALLKPAFIVCEGVDGATDDEEQDILALRRLRRRAAKAWKSFKVAAISSFTYVETAGLLFAGRIATDSLGLTRTVPDPKTDGLDRDVIGRVAPHIAPRRIAGRQTGFDVQQRIDMAERVLRAMSLTGGFAPLVLLTGHGSTTMNNPHSSALDCGACGGHTGEANARVAAAILNDPDVRSGLDDRGIAVPTDTWFLAALHDTTTDIVRIFDEHKLPPSHVDALKVLKGLLRDASRLARKERAGALGIKARQEHQIVRRSRDWSQVRPEWGLARNAMFVAAPRKVTRGIDLGGRAFLHDYDWRLDQGFGVLELIMTAPMVVASWINLQYFGSTVNNRAFGAGNKVLHNVAGTIGVLEGNAGDLRAGLPWQSVHDGRLFVHEPLRLNVMIAAPLDAIDRVIAKHESVRELVDNGWLHLFALSDAGSVSHRYRGQLTWEALP